MLWTLQKYIFREMGKAFLLTSIGLIVVIGLGGGVMNMLELEGVTALQLIRILALIVPVAATLTLPIAALYAATVTYGRLSADNEFVACRSGGINIHILLLPTVVLSCLSAICSFCFINFMIPNMVMNIDRFIGDDLPRLIKQRLSSADRLNMRGKFVVYAEETELVSLGPSEGEKRPGLRLGGVVFVEMDGEEWSKFGTAKSVDIAFGKKDGLATVAADMYGISLYDAKADGYYEKRHLPMGEQVIPRRIPLRVKWLTLGGLLQYGRQPSLFPKISEDLAKLRERLALAILYRNLIGQFKSAMDEFKSYGQVTINATDGRYVIRSTSLRPSKGESRLAFQGDVEVLATDAQGHTSRATADSASIHIELTGHAERLRFQVAVAGHVAIYTEEAPGGQVRRQKELFAPVSLPPEVLKEVGSYSDAELLDIKSGDLGLGKWVEERRAHVATAVANLSRDITGELHSRMALSLSVFVLVILGAALGIVFRGSQILVAFGISFVPSMLVISLIIMGKQLINNAATMNAGIGVIWGGILLVAAVDYYVLMKVVRR